MQGVKINQGRGVFLIREGLIGLKQRSSRAFIGEMSALIPEGPVVFRFSSVRIGKSNIRSFELLL